MAHNFIETKFLVSQYLKSPFLKVCEGVLCLFIYFLS